MQWSNVTGKVAELYQAVGEYVFNHQVEFDVIIIGAVLLAVYKYVRREGTTKRQRISYLRGSWMSREERERYHLMRFEDAIGDAALDMIIEGRMNDEEEKFWYRFFADKYGMKGLLPMRTREGRIKGIMTRINFYRKSRPVPGGVAAVTPDPNYKPTFEQEKSGLSTSKFAR